VRRVTDVGQAGELERVASAGPGRRYRTIEIRAGNRVMAAADQIPSDLHDALDRLCHDPAEH
jgi:hypothetical protein